MNRKKMCTISGIIFLAMSYLSFLVASTAMYMRGSMPDLAYILGVALITGYIALKIQTLMLDLIKNESNNE